MNNNFYYNLIAQIFDTTSDYIEWGEEEAQFLFNTFVKNASLFTRTLKHSITIDDKIGKRIYTPIGFRIDHCETDAIEEFVDGTINFNGACEFSNGEGYMLRIQTRNFKIFDAMAMNFEDDTEIPLVDKGKVVNGLKRVTSQTGAQSYGNIYTYTYGETIE